MADRNRALASALAATGISNKGLAKRVRDLSQRDNQAVSTDHVAISRYLDGMQPKARTAHYIAVAISEKTGRSLAPADLGFTAAGGVEREPTVASTVLYPESVDATTENLGELTRADAAPGAVPALGRWDNSAAPSVITGYLFGGPSALTIPPPADAPPVDAITIRATTAHLMDLDFQLGGGHTRELLLFFFRNQVLPVLTASSGRAAQQQELFSATAELAQLLGWTAYDSGRHGAAQRYFVYALRLAREADDALMGARLLSNLSHQANYLGRFEQAVQLARAGLATPSPRKSGRVTAMLFAMEARGLASLGDGPGSAAAITRAERAYAARNPDMDPEWARYFDEVELAGEAAHCFRDLHRAAEVEEFATLAIVPGTTPARTLAFINMVSAASALDAGNLDIALSLTQSSMASSTSLSSSRYQRYISDFFNLARNLHPREPSIIALESANNQQSAATRRSS